MSQRKSENTEIERERIQNTQGDDIEGPGPPEPPTGQERGSSPIDQWVQGLRDDIDEIVAGITQSDQEEDQNQQRGTEEAKVEDWTVSKICDELKNGRFKNIVVFTGAGISTDAGIPDFRSPDKGLYNQPGYKLNRPEEAFSLPIFKMNPKPFYALAKKIMPGKFSPTLAHHFIAMLEEKGLLSHYFTQNIDGLDKMAGISEEKLIQVHGTFESNHCSVCNESANHDLVIKAMQNGEPLQCPRCTISGKTSWIKPDITFYGERLPERFYKVLESGVLKKCDLLIIIGTSLQVPPATDVLLEVPEDCPRLMINRESVKSHDNIEFSDKQNCATESRDVFMKTEANDGCIHLAAMLGFKEELIKRRITAFENKIGN